MLFFAWLSAWVSVLVWHDVQPSKQVWFDTTLATFRSQVNAIAAGRFNVIPLEALRAHILHGKPLQPRSIVLTFDDNGSGICEYAFPLLQAHHFPATLFVHTNFVGVTTSKRHCTWQQLRILQASGLITIQSLTANHPPDLRRLSDADVVHELELSRFSLTQRLGRAPFAFVYPENNFDERLARLVGAHGYDLAFTENWGNAEAPEDRLTIHRYSALTRFDQALRDVATGTQ